MSKRALEIGLENRDFALEDSLIEEFRIENEKITLEIPSGVFVADCPDPEEKVKGARVELICGPEREIDCVKISRHRILHLPCWNAKNFGIEKVLRQEKKLEIVGCYTSYRMLALVCSSFPYKKYMYQIQIYDVRKIICYVDE